MCTRIGRTARAGNRRRCHQSGLRGVCDVPPRTSSRTLSQIPVARSHRNCWRNLAPASPRKRRERAPERGRSAAQADARPRVVASRPHSGSSQHSGQHGGQQRRHHNWTRPPHRAANGLCQRRRKDQTQSAGSAAPPTTSGNDRNMAAAASRTPTATSRQSAARCRSARQQEGRHDGRHGGRHERSHSQQRAPEQHQTARGAATALHRGLNVSVIEVVSSSRTVQSNGR